MNLRITLGRALGFVTLAAALASGTAMASNTPQGLKADGLRWQAMANAYEQRQDSRHYTEQGLKADGLRLQRMAQRYAFLQDRPAASFYTARALEANGLRWQAMAQAYARPQVSTVSASRSFDWTDAGIGAASGFALALCVAVLIACVRRRSEAELAV